MRILQKRKDNTVLFEFSMNPDYIYMEKTLVLNLVKHFFIPDGGDVAACFIKSVKSHRTAFHE